MGKSVGQSGQGRGTARGDQSQGDGIQKGLVQRELWALGFPGR